MTEPVLCLVSLFLLWWVIVLKMRIAHLESGDTPDRGKEPTAGANRYSDVKGARSFRIG